MMPCSLPQQLFPSSQEGSTAERLFWQETQQLCAFGSPTHAHMIVPKAGFHAYHRCSKGLPAAPSVRVPHASPGSEMGMHTNLESYKS